MIRINHLLPLALLTACVLFAGCGSDDDSTSSFKENATTSAPAATGATSTTEATVPEARSGGEPKGKTSTAAAQPTVDGDYLETIRSQLDAAGADPKLTECIISDLESSLSEEDLAQVEAGKIPPGLAQMASEVGRNCQDGK